MAQAHVNEARQERPSGKHHGLCLIGVVTFGLTTFASASDIAKTIKSVLSTGVTIGKKIQAYYDKKTKDKEKIKLSFHEATEFTFFTLGVFQKNTKMSNVYHFLTEVAFTEALSKGKQDASGKIKKYIVEIAKAMSFETDASQKKPVTDFIGFLMKVIDTDVNTKIDKQLVIDFLALI